MVEGHYLLDGHELEQAPEVGDGQESLACCSPWGRKELDTTERRTEVNNPNQKRSSSYPGKTPAT